METVGIFKMGIKANKSDGQYNWKAIANFLNKFVLKFAFFYTYILYSDFKAKYFRMYKNAIAYYIDNK